MPELFENSKEEESEATAFLEKMMEKLKELFNIRKIFSDMKAATDEKTDSQ